MKSMTGYGSAINSNRFVSIEVSIRCVNGRYLDPRFHLPRELMKFESHLKKTLSQMITRGTVDIYIHRKIKNTAGLLSVAVNKEVLRQYLNAYKKISKDSRLPFHVSIDSLIRLPEIISVDTKMDLHSGEEELLKNVFQKACKACDKEKNREGLSLQKELISLLRQLESEVETISALRDQANSLLRERFEQRIRSRMNESVKDLSFDSQRIAQEIVIQLEKSDINEEVVRLKEHISSYAQLLRSATAEGKKMDFYTQELLREINTIGSKSQIAKITESVVEAKTIIERMREQVQNVQ